MSGALYQVTFVLFVFLFVYHPAVNDSISDSMSGDSCSCTQKDLQYQTLFFQLLSCSRGDLGMLTGKTGAKAVVVPMSQELLSLVR